MMHSDLQCLISARETREQLDHFPGRDTSQGRYKAWVRGFFQGKFLIRNISGYDDDIETKFGTQTDFTVLNIFK